jgi:hypothetical protein
MGAFIFFIRQCGDSGIPICIHDDKGEYDNSDSNSNMAQETHAYWQAGVIVVAEESLWRCRSAIVAATLL